MLQQLFCKPHMGRRLIVLALSVFVMGAGVAVFDQLGFGTDPCSVLNLGVSRMIGWSFGNYQLVFNSLLLTVILLCGEARRIGPGTVANMVLVGYSADFCAWMLNSIHPLHHETLLVRLIVFVPAMAAFLIAVAFYMVVDLGVAPYDALPQIIASRQSRLSFSAVRVLWDVAAIAAGIVVGGTVGAVTIIMGFFLGPVISAIARRFQKWFE